MFNILDMADFFSICSFSVYFPLLRLQQLQFSDPTASPNAIYLQFAFIYSLQYICDSS